MWPFKRSYKEAPSLSAAVEILLLNRVEIWGRVGSQRILFPVKGVCPYRDEYKKQRWYVRIDTTGCEIKREG